MSALLDCFSTNPTRPPTWRWQRAVALRDNDETAIPLSRRTDGALSYRWISRGLKFAAAWREALAAETVNAMVKLATKFPEIYWAHDIWSKNDNVRHTIEANILAKADDDVVSNKTGVTAETVHAYEALFFDVRSRLQFRDFIIHKAIPSVHVRSGGISTESATLWKLYGYFYGPAMVDAMVSQFPSVNGWCDSPDKVGAAIIDDVIGTLKLKAAVAAKGVTNTGANQLQLLEIFTKFVEVERTTDSAGSAQTQLTAHINAMMATMPFQLNSRQVRGSVQPTDVDVFDQSAVELTHEETIRLSLGEPIAHAATLRNLTFPEPPRLQGPTLIVPTAPTRNSPTPRGD